MKELSMHILDLVQNSIRAKAKQIKIYINEDYKTDKYTIEIIDDGTGIPKEMIDSITNPFVTERATRKVGLGIPLFRAAAQQCGGDLLIESVVNEGTDVEVTFLHGHIDRAPLGDMAGTMLTLIAGNVDIEFEFKYIFNGNEFVFDTREIKKHIEGIDIDNSEVLNWIDGYINDGIREVSNKSLNG